MNHKFDGNDRRYIYCINLANLCQRTRFFIHKSDFAIKLYARHLSWEGNILHVLQHIYISLLVSLIKPVPIHSETSSGIPYLLPRLSESNHVSTHLVSSSSTTAICHKWQKTEYLWLYSASLQGSKKKCSSPWPIGFIHSRRFLTIDRRKRFISNRLIAVGCVWMPSARVHRFSCGTHLHTFLWREHLA